MQRFKCNHVQIDPPEVGEVGPSFIYEVGYRIRRMASNFERAIKSDGISLELVADISIVIGR